MTTAADQKIEIHVTQLFKPIYWGALALGALFVMSGWNSTNGMGMMIVGCFLGILSRVVQAEHHHQQTARAEIAPVLRPPLDMPGAAGR